MYDEVYAVLNPLGAVDNTLTTAMRGMYTAMKALPDLQNAIGDSDPEFNVSVQFVRFEDQLSRAINTAAAAQDQAADVCRQVWNLYGKES